MGAGDCDGDTLRHLAQRRDASTGMTALHHACEAKQPHAVASLLRIGADPNVNVGSAAPKLTVPSSVSVNSLRASGRQIVVPKVRLSPLKSPFLGSLSSPLSSPYWALVLKVPTPRPR
jgi:ankyrin repeat protein